MKTGGYDDEVEEIEKLREIGSGGSASVFEGMCKVNGRNTKVALKYFRYGCNSSIIANEYNILRSLSHPNIVKMVCFQPSLNLLVLEYCAIVWNEMELHNIADWSKSFLNRSLEVDCNVIKQILSGLEYLHENDKLHCDMKPPNCLTKGEVSHPTVKLADFGLAFNQSSMSSSTKHSSIGRNEIGTLLYKAPESCQASKDWRTKANDIYAFGMSLAEIMFPDRESAYGSLLQDVGNIMGIYSLKLQGTLPPLSEHPKHWDSKSWKSLSEAIIQCLSTSPMTRPTANALKNTIVEIEGNISESNSESQDTMSITSYMQSQADFNLGLEEDEIIISEKSDIEKLHKYYQIESEHCKLLIEDLLISQDSPTTALGCIALNVPVPQYSFDSYKTFLAMAEMVSLSQMENVFDATNACTWLCVDICSQKIDQMTIEGVAENVRNIVFENPRSYNKIRDSSRYYSVNEVLAKTNAQFSAFEYVNLNFFTAKDDDIFEENMKIALEDCYTFGNVDENPLKIIYNCGPYACVIICTSSHIVYVDTHSVPPIQNGVVMFFIGVRGHSIRSVAKILRTRFHLSLKEKLYEVNHALTVLVRRDEIINHVDKFTETFSYNHLEQLQHESNLNRLSNNLNCAEKQNLILRAHQELALQKILYEKRDTILVWATGSGKTFTTMKIIARQKQSSVVIIPTLCLLLDIEAQLKAEKVSCTTFCSLRQGSIEDIMRLALESRTKAILCTPEYCVKLSKFQFFEKFNQDIGIDLIVSEEAHCDLMWSSFRCDMIASKKVFQSIPDAVRVAITASPIGGDTNVTADLACLKPNYFVSKFGLYRKDLKLDVLTEKTTTSYLAEILKNHKNQ